MVDVLTIVEYNPNSPSSMKQLTDLLTATLSQEGEESVSKGKRKKDEEEGETQRDSKHLKCLDEESEFWFEPRALSNYTIIFSNTGQKIHIPLYCLYVGTTWFKTWIEDNKSKDVTTSIELPETFKFSYKAMKRFLLYINFDITGINHEYPFLLKKGESFTWKTLVGDNTNRTWTNHYLDDVVLYDTINDGAKNYCSASFMERNLGKMEIFGDSAIEIDWEVIQISQFFGCIGLLKTAETCFLNIHGYTTLQKLEILAKIVELNLVKEFDMIRLCRDLKRDCFTPKGKELIKKYQLYEYLYEAKV